MNLIFYHCLYTYDANCCVVLYYLVVYFGVHLMNTQQWLEFQALVEKSLTNLSGRFTKRIRKVSFTQPYREKMAVLLKERVPSSFFVGLNLFRVLWLRYQLHQVMAANTYGEAEARLIKVSDSLYRLSRKTKNPQKRRAQTNLSLRLYNISQGVITLGICHWANITSRRLGRFLREHQLEDQEVLRLLEMVGTIQPTQDYNEVSLMRSMVRASLSSLHDYTLSHYCVDAHAV